MKFFEKQQIFKANRISKQHNRNKHNIILTVFSVQLSSPSRFTIPQVFFQRTGTLDVFKKQHRPGSHPVPVTRFQAEDEKDKTTFF